MNIDVMSDAVLCLCLDVACLDDTYADLVKVASFCEMRVSPKKK